MANHYNIASYRADNKKLRVILPGELRAQHENKPLEVRQNIEKKQLDIYIAEISKAKSTKLDDPTSIIAENILSTRK
jgi:hypothetical protein